MIKALLILVASSGMCVTPVHADGAKFAFVDIRDRANMRLDDNFGTERVGNNLASLKRNEQEFEGIPFKIADTFLQLGSKQQKTRKPDKIVDIKVGRTFSQIHFLQATGNGCNQRGAPVEQDPLFVADDTPIAEYRIHYVDGTVERIPVVYGKDVRDWWYPEGAQGVSRGKVAWEGENPIAKKSMKKIRLYLGSWKNPHPTKKVRSIDFVKIGDTPAAPFCVAISIEK